MSLALVQLPISDFDQIYDHVSTHTRHRNMHLREARTYQRQRVRYRVLDFLHALYAPAATREIVGMITGRNLFWHYRLRPAASMHYAQVQVLTPARSSPQDAVRLQNRFHADLLGRVQQELSGASGYPNYLPGQFYLRRRSPGMPVAHPHCQAAIASGELDQRFVAQLHSWNLELIHR
jgi:hypothetical protein